MSHGLEVFVDFTQPHSWLALAPTRALALSARVSIDWQPLLVPALKPPAEPRAGETRGEQHRRMRAAYYGDDLRRYARVQGRTLHDPYLDLDGRPAAAGLLWLRECAPESVDAYVDAVFGAIWERGEDLAKPDAVARCAEQAGADVAAFRAALAGADRLEPHLAGLAEQGLFNAPGYRIARADGSLEIFQGRAHLPMIAWILDGESGPVPI